MAAPATASSSSSLAVSSSPPPWSCVACTYQNATSRDVCDMCGTRRSSITKVATSSITPNTRSDGIPIAARNEGGFPHSLPFAAPPSVTDAPVTRSSLISSSSPPPSLQFQPVPFRNGNATVPSTASAVVSSISIPSSLSSSSSGSAFRPHSGGSRATSIGHSKSSSVSSLFSWNNHNNNVNNSNNGVNGVNNNGGNESDHKIGASQRKTISGSTPSDVFQISWPINTRIETLRGDHFVQGSIQGYQWDPSYQRWSLLVLWDDHDKTMLTHADTCRLLSPTASSLSSPSYASRVQRKQTLLQRKSLSPPSRQAKASYAHHNHPNDDDDREYVQVPAGPAIAPLPSPPIAAPIPHHNNHHVPNNQHASRRNEGEIPRRSRGHVVSGAHGRDIWIEDPLVVDGKGNGSVPSSLTKRSSLRSLFGKGLDQSAVSSQHYESKGPAGPLMHDGALWNQYACSGGPASWNHGYTSMVAIDSQLMIFSTDTDDKRNNEGVITGISVWTLDVRSLERASITNGRQGEMSPVWRLQATHDVGPSARWGFSVIPISRTHVYLFGTRVNTLTLCASRPFLDIGILLKNRRL
jgi:hypothetical protein